MSGPKFRRRAEARPDEVLDAALALFMEKGFAATRVEDVAARAGLSKGAVYLYFPSKEALLEGLVLRSMAPLAGAVAELAAIEGDSARARLEAALGFLQEKARDPAISAIPVLVLRESAQFPGLATLYRERVIGRLFPALAGLVARAVDRGEIRRVDPAQAVLTILAPVVVQILLGRVFGFGQTPDAAADRAMLRHHLDIVFEGLGAK